MGTTVVLDPGVSGETGVEEPGIVEGTVVVDPVEAGNVVVVLLGAAGGDTVVLVDVAAGTEVGAGATVVCAQAGVDADIQYTRVVTNPIDSRKWRLTSGARLYVICIHLS